MSLPWGVQTNLEKSLSDFLTAQATSDDVDVNIEVAEKVDENWELPHIQINSDSKQKPRAEIGSNKRANTYLLILDVRAQNNPERKNLADWIEDKIKIKRFSTLSHAVNEALLQLKEKIESNE